MTGSFADDWPYGIFWLSNLSVYCIVKHVLEPNLTQHIVIHILYYSWQFTAKWDITWLRNLTVYCILKHVLEPNLTQHMVIHILHNSWQFTAKWDITWLRNLTVYCIVKCVFQPNLTQHIVMHILGIYWHLLQSELIWLELQMPTFNFNRNEKKHGEQVLQAMVSLISFELQMPTWNHRIARSDLVANLQDCKIRSCSKITRLQDPIL